MPEPVQALVAMPPWRKPRVPAGWGADVARDALAAVPRYRHVTGHGHVAYHAMLVAWSRLMERSSRSCRPLASSARLMGNCALVPLKMATRLPRKSFTD